VAVLFISHRLDEVFEIADRVTVLRDGRRISSRPRDEVTPQRAIQEMVGREMSEFFARTEHPRGGLAIRVSGIGRTGAFADVSFEVHKGEVLGLAGLVGAGRTDVALALFGIAPAESGSVELDGRPVVIRSPREALRHGIAYLSEDRRQLGLSLPQSLTANITLATLDRYVTRLRLVDSSAERAVADRFRRRLSIRTPSLETPVERLSGGNQQKTMLAKWLNAAPTVLILDEPTRGIDVGAKAEVHHIIDELARSGMAIILISSDLPEVLAMSDRIRLFTVEGVIAGWMLAGASVPGQRCANAAGGPILCHRSQWTSSRTRSDRSTAHPIAQVKHPVALNHHVGILQQVLCVDRPEVALAGPEHDGYDVHAHLVDQARGKHLATDVTSGDLDDAVTRKLLRLGYGCLDAVDEVKRRLGVPALGLRPVRHDDHVVDPARRLPVPAVRQVEDVAADECRPDLVPVRPGVVVGGLRHLHRAALVQRDVTVGQPVEQRSGLVMLVRDEAVHRHRAVHDHLAHGALLCFGVPAN
jgi:ABC-type multidrug transport system ATPase subunit